jgi:hypothetical protein
MNRHLFENYFTKNIVVQNTYCYYFASPVEAKNSFKKIHLLVTPAPAPVMFLQPGNGHHVAKLAIVVFSQYHRWAVGNKIQIINCYSESSFINQWYWLPMHFLLSDLQRQKMGGCKYQSVSRHLQLSHWSEGHIKIEHSQAVWIHWEWAVCILALYRPQIDVLYFK